MVGQIPWLECDLRHPGVMTNAAKITFAEMRASGVYGLLVYCADYRCRHHIAISANQWSDEVRLSDIQLRFVCTACGRRGADVRPDFVPAKTGAA